MPWKRRNTPKSHKTTSRSFYVAELTGFRAGPAAFLNSLFDQMEHSLVEDGAKIPFGINFGGGDGKTSPVTVDMYETSRGLGREGPNSGD